MTPFEFIVLALAVHRATHFITEDQFPAVVRPRNWVVTRWPDGWQSYLVTCFWCVSVWMAAGAVAACYLWTPQGWHGVPAPAVLWLALSTAATSFEYVLERLDVGGDG